MIPERRRFAAIAAVLVAACSTASARTDLVPPMTDDFLAYCKTDTDSCDQFIGMVHNINLMQRTVTYCYPQSATESEAGRKAFYRSVILWMAEHAETHDQPTDDSVRAALAALYPCRR